MIAWLLAHLKGIAVVAGLAVVFLAGRNFGAAGVQAKFDRAALGWQTEKTAAATATAEWQAKARAQEGRERSAEKQLTDIARAIDHDGQTRIEAQRAATGRATAAVAGLRDELAAVVADAASAAESSKGAADAREREAAAEAARLLVDMLGSCHERGAARARFADEAADAGAACERWASTVERELNQAHE